MLNKYAQQQPLLFSRMYPKHFWMVFLCRRPLWKHRRRSSVRLQTPNNMCMDAYNNVMTQTPNNPIMWVMLISPCNDANAQKWVYDDGHYLRPMHNTNLCLAKKKQEVCDVRWSCQGIVAVVKMYTYSTPVPVPAPAVSADICGGGYIGNGIRSNAWFCSPSFSWCGTGAAYCGG